MINVSVKIGPDPAPPPPPEPDPDPWPYTLYRMYHDYEIYQLKVAVPGHGQFYQSDRSWDWRASKDLPEVFWWDQGTKTPITAAAQRLIMAMNPNAPGKKLRIAFDFMRAFTNHLGNGFDTKHDPGTPEYVPLQDHFTGVDLAAGPPNFDKIRVCGGASLAGFEMGGYFYPEYIPWDNVPPWSDLQKTPWKYFRAINCHSRSGPTFSDFPQGGGYPLLIPFIAKGPIRLPAAAFQKYAPLEGDNKLLDPMRLYV